MTAKDLLEAAFGQSEDELKAYVEVFEKHRKQIDDHNRDVFSRVCPVCQTKETPVAAGWLCSEAYKRISDTAYETALTKGRPVVCCPVCGVLRAAKEANNE